MKLWPFTRNRQAGRRSPDMAEIAPVAARGNEVAAAMAAEYSLRAEEWHAHAVELRAEADRADPDERYWLDREAEEADARGAALADFAGEPDGRVAVWPDRVGDDWADERDVGAPEAGRSGESERDAGDRLQDWIEEQDALDDFWQDQVDAYQDEAAELSQDLPSLWENYAASDATRPLGPEPLYPNKDGWYPGMPVTDLVDAPPGADPWRPPTAETATAMGEQAQFEVDVAADTLADSADFWQDQDDIEVGESVRDPHEVRALVDRLRGGEVSDDALAEIGVSRADYEFMLDAEALAARDATVDNIADAAAVEFQDPPSSRPGIWLGEPTNSTGSHATPPLQLASYGYQVGDVVRNRQTGATFTVTEPVSDWSPQYYAPSGADRGSADRGSATASFGDAAPGADPWRPPTAAPVNTPTADATEPVLPRAAAHGVGPAPTAWRRDARPSGISRDEFRAPVTQAEVEALHPELAGFRHDDYSSVPAGLNVAGWLAEQELRTALARRHVLAVEHVDHTQDAATPGVLAHESVRELARERLAGVEAELADNAAAVEQARQRYADLLQAQGLTDRRAVRDTPEPGQVRGETADVADVSAGPGRSAEPSAAARAPVRDAQDAVARIDAVCAAEEAALAADRADQLNRWHADDAAVETAADLSASNREVI